MDCRGLVVGEGKQTCGVDDLRALRRVERRAIVRAECRLTADSDGGNQRSSRRGFKIAVVGTQMLTTTVTCNGNNRACVNEITVDVL